MGSLTNIFNIKHVKPKYLLFFYSIYKILILISCSFNYHLFDIELYEALLNNYGKCMKKP